LRITLSVVYDVFAARIRALRSKDQGWQTVAEWGVGASEATDLAERARVAEGGEHLLCVICRLPIHYFVQYIVDINL